MLISGPARASPGAGNQPTTGAAPRRGGLGILGTARTLFQSKDDPEGCYVSHPSYAVISCCEYACARRTAPDKTREISSLDIWSG